MYVSEFFNYYPFLYYYGMPRNFHHASDSYNSLWFEMVDNNFSSVFYSMYEYEYTEDINFYGYGHTHSGIESSMYWQICASFPARNGEGLTASYELILVGSFSVPIGVSVFKPCYRVDDQSSGITVSLTLYDRADLNTVVYTRETSIFFKSNEVLEDTAIPVDGFSTDNGFRRIFFRLSAKTVTGSSGTFYEFIAALPRIEGLDF